MGFELSRRYGRYWEDCKTLDKLVNKYRFNTTGKNEREFEHGFANTLMTSDENYTCNIITQIDKETTVQSVYCFGSTAKSIGQICHWMKMVFIELKFITYAGLKDAVERVVNDLSLGKWNWRKKIACNRIKRLIYF